MNGYPPDEEVVAALAEIHQGNWQRGILMLAEKHKRIAKDAVMEALPTDAAAISRAQCAYKIWSIDIPNILDWATAFAKEQNANQQGA